MWICGGLPELLWSTLPLQALLCFALAWCLGEPNWTRGAAIAAVGSALLLEGQRLTFLYDVWVERPSSPFDLIDFKLELSYLGLVVGVVALGAGMAQRLPDLRSSRASLALRAFGWTGGLAFLVPGPRLLLETARSPVPFAVSAMAVAFFLTSVLFVSFFAPLS